MCCFEVFARENEIDDYRINTMVPQLFLWAKNKGYVRYFKDAQFNLVYIGTLLLRLSVEFLILLGREQVPDTLAWKLMVVRATEGLITGLREWLPPFRGNDSFVKFVRVVVKLVRRIFQSGSKMTRLTEGRIKLLVKLVNDLQPELHVSEDRVRHVATLPWWFSRSSWQFFKCIYVYLWRTRCVLLDVCFSSTASAEKESNKL